MADVVDVRSAETDRILRQWFKTDSELSGVPAGDDVLDKFDTGPSHPAVLPVEHMDAVYVVFPVG